VNGRREVAPLGSPTDCGPAHHERVGTSSGRGRLETGPYTGGGARMQEGAGDAGMTEGAWLRQARSTVIDVGTRRKDQRNSE